MSELSNTDPMSSGSDTIPVRKVKSNMPRKQSYKRIKFDLDYGGGVWRISNDFDIKSKIIDMNQPDAPTYNRKDATLLQLMPNAWFNSVDNIFKLVGYFRTKPHVQSQFVVQTYLAVLYANDSKGFNLARAADDWNRWTGKNYVSTLNDTVLKSIAGGTNPEQYRKWKAYHEPVDPKASRQDSELKIVDVLRSKLVKLAKNKYRREETSGAIYEYKYKYYYARAFDNAESFLTHVFKDDETYSTISAHDHKEILYWIRMIHHNDFPFIRYDHKYIGFSDGIYDLNVAQFIPTNHIDQPIQVRKLLHQPYSIVDTPLLDAYLQFQFEQDDIEFIYFLVGRMMTRLDDHFDFMVLIYGQGGSGKSLLLKLLMRLFSPDQVGILSSGFQGQFGLSEFASKQFVACDDMPSNLARVLDKGDWLKMMSRGAISCPVKGKGSIEVHDWNIPTCINSNMLPNYRDESGEIVRRIMMINFEKTVPEDMKNLNLESEIAKTELCTFMHRCRSTYLEYKTKYSSNGVETFCPQTFIDNRLILRKAVNKTCSFIDSQFQYCNGAQMTVPEINRIFKIWLMNQCGLDRKPSDKINPQSISLIDHRYEHKKVNICKHCTNIHKKGCCESYSRTQRSTRDLILNIKLNPIRCDESE